MDSLTIEWSPGETVTGLLDGPASARTGILLAHGAGAGQHHPFMAGLRSRLAAGGVPVLTFDYPYAAAGRKAPDRLVRLLECHRAAYQALKRVTDRIVVAGKSMGGRVGGHLVGEGSVDAAGLVFFGYPLIPIGKDQPRSTDHLEACRVPMLFFQGERDRLGPPDAVRAVIGRIPDATLQVIEDADHGFSVPKRAGLSNEDVLDRLAEETIRFVG